MGVHYPTDVVGGFALGTAVALLLSPPAMALLTLLMRAAERSPRAGWIVRRRPPAEVRREALVPGTRRSVESGERDLAA